MSVLNLPNTLTITRIVLIPIFVITVIYQRYDYSLILFIIASLTDALDGLIARLRSEKTALGSFLDPLADKFLLVTSFVVFTIYGFIPAWLTIIAISRDVIIVTGWFVLYLITHNPSVESSILGKSAITLQLLLVCYILLELNIPALPDIHVFLFWLTAFFTILSGLHYIYRGLTHGSK